jgi:dTDP-4-amino-4,6-dideoxygalactose transaminase
MPAKTLTELEHRIANSLERKHCCLVGRGATAIYLALRALPVTRGKVLLPAVVCPSPANAVLYAGLEPVFCDVNLDDYTLDIVSLQRVLAMHDDIVAIMPVHLYGYPADMEPIQTIARERRLFVIEDAAQALGAKYHGKPVGAFGDFSILSFGHTKILDVGIGGAVLCDDDALALSVRRALADVPECPAGVDRRFADYRTVYYTLRDLCQMDEQLNDLYLPLPSIYRDMYLFRLPAETVGKIDASLDLLPSVVEKRRRNAREYDRLLAHPLIRKPKYRRAGVPWRFSFLLRDDVQAALTARLRALKVDVSNWYPPLYRWYASSKTQPRDLFPSADFLGTHIVNLWVDPSVEAGSIGRTCEALLNILCTLDAVEHTSSNPAQEVPRDRT